MKQYFYPREWFFIAMQLVAAGIFVWAIVTPISWHYWLLSLVGYFLITCEYNTFVTRTD